MTSVRSVLAQSFRDFEYIIVDDGSTEETLTVLQTLDDPRIQVVRQANDGLSSARNTALALAKGDYVCFLDADDVRPNWSFSAIVNALDAACPDVLFCPGILQDLRGEITHFYDTAIFDKIGEIIPGGMISRSEADFSRVCSLAQQMEPQSANKVIRRDFLEQTGIIFPNTHFFEDIFFHTNVVVRSDRIAILDCPAFTYFRRYQRPQITSTTSDLRFDILAVSKLTLEAFAFRPEFHDPGQRAAVFASCLKTIEWCEVSISHLHRKAFRQSAQALVAMIDPLFTHLPLNLPPEAGNLDSARRYLQTLMGHV